MTKKAILFGSIGTLVETSELQRQAFNQAFAEAGISWTWEPEEYRQLLAKSGGRKRIEDYATERGENVDAHAVHTRKTEIFDNWMIERGLSLRPGVKDVISQAKDDGLKLAFVTTTSRENIDAIFKALGDELSPDDFDFIGDATLVSAGKPSPEIFHLALKHIGCEADACTAIEDTPVSASAARAAGIDTVAFPGEYADRDGFAGVMSITDKLDYGDLVGAS